MEGNSPWLQCLHESLEMVGSTPWGHTCPDLLWQPRKAGKNTGMLAGVANCGSQKWGCRGRLAPGFKPRLGSHDKKNHMALGLPLPCSLGSWKARCSCDAELSLSSLEECRRNAEERKGVKGLLLVCHEKVPCGFGLRTGDTVDGAGNQGRPTS